MEHYYMLIFLKICVTYISSLRLNILWTFVTVSKNFAIFVRPVVDGLGIRFRHAFQSYLAPFVCAY